LRAAEASRVVSLSSMAARSGRMHFDDLQFENSYAPMRAYGQSKLSNLIFARELARRSREGGWGVTSTAGHPGLTKTNLQISGPSHGRAKPSTMERFYKFSWRFMPFMWQEVDEGILPALYAATSPQAQNGAFYGPRGFMELAGGGVIEADTPSHAKNEADGRRLWEVSERLTGVTYAA
jgi:NAD(P)-dependent dehydrogenase (short-subunit alcohol dehydrogenase family)